MNRFRKSIGRTVLLAMATLLSAGCAGQTPASVWQSDQGDGTYQNPPLNADYPDPDIIRVGEDFYFVTTTFANVPGLTMLHSHDLVNWDIIGHVARRLDGASQYDLADGGAYRAGVYAPSLRYRNGTFYVAVTPVGRSTRIYSSRDPRGAWSYVELGQELFDPALFFDDDGGTYLASAIGTDGTVTLHTLDHAVSRIVSSRVVHYNEGAEGSKIIRRGDWYYLFNSIPRRLGMTVSRAKSLFGPWETRPSIDDTTGGHQGALVDLPDGTFYGFVMLDAGAKGRVTNFSPVFWQDDWPIWGTPDAPNRVPARAAKPIGGYAQNQPVASDDFAGADLGLQWQWNHNPIDALWSLTERPGWLRLRAAPGAQLWWARNTLVQKGQAPRGRGEVVVDASGIRAGDVCGFGTFGKFSGQLSILGQPDGTRALTMRVTESTENGPVVTTRVAALPITAVRVWLRTDMDFPAERTILSYSLDGTRFTPVGGEVPLVFDWRTGTFQGVQFALSCYNPGGEGGAIDVDSFTLSALPR